MDQKELAAFVQNVAKAKGNGFVPSPEVESFFLQVAALFTETLAQSVAKLWDQLSKADAMVEEFSAILKRVKAVMAKGFIPPVGMEDFFKIIVNKGLEYVFRAYYLSEEDFNRIKAVLPEAERKVVEFPIILKTVKEAHSKGFVPPEAVTELFESIADGDIRLVYFVAYDKYHEESFGALRKLVTRLAKFAEAELSGKVCQIGAIGKADPVFAEHQMREEVKAGNFVFNRPGSSHVEVYA